MKHREHMYEVTLMNIVTAADNPIEAVTQFYNLHHIPLDEQDDVVFEVKDVDTGQKFEVEGDQFQQVSPPVPI